MYISHKSNVILQFGHTEWECRMYTKKMSPEEYWPWVDSITSGDPPVADYSSETDYTIVECVDENIQTRLAQLDEYISHTSSEGTIYNIKYYASKRDAEEILNIDEKSHDPKQYVQSHFVPDDSAKDARILADEWKIIRKERDRLIAETDWMMLSDT